jgi:hypothetical protein
LPEPSIYDYLAKKNVAELTVEQLNTATKSTNLDPVNIEFWQGIITLHRVLNDSRTFGAGLPIPETGSTATVTIADGANAPIKPSGTEIYRLMNVDFDSCTAALTDGDGNYSIIDTSTDGWFNMSPIYLSANLFLTFFNGTGSEQTPTIAFFKVAL